MKTYTFFFTFQGCYESYNSIELQVKFLIYIVIRMQ